MSESVMESVRLHFPLPPPVMTALTDPVLTNTINDFVDCMHLRPDVTDLCTRIGSSSVKGGIWGVARRFGDREVYVLIEDCGTLNEMHESIKRARLDLLCDFII